MAEPCGSRDNMEEACRRFGEAVATVFTVEGFLAARQVR